ncbi:MAG: 50S ribosomal protein L4 [Candidatus Colwellbacteria bacterium CG10_big_fil_rev_8_21_14_0_10_41_28]|uniref:Large ribosomal subunit protein uL4 n=1 Tax=Candidatus Colwellbacteria bacterium CG10_big_fil_rev_8_21_14_0_10_41_28 TaxID=1974539 RepID=A0A2H0VH61_9BACT|nr:MAG: 50S ribosomal protein L4 [Candidatus Colwellbacteria bacterium CG10_big_fil_rev_8_21_14_0_10_41_28]
MKADLYNIKGDKAGSVELVERIFAERWSPNLVHMALRTQETNKRENFAHTKDRSAVSGGGRKPWRQKGTGRARHGSTRSPIWVGGGVTHGPLSDKKYSLKINKKARQKAFFSILARRFKDGEIKIVEKVSIDEPKTRLLLEALEIFSKDLNVLVIVSGEHKDVHAASRNLNRVKIMDARGLNVYDLLRYKTILIEKDAVDEINTHYNAIK